MFTSGATEANRLGVLGTPYGTGTVACSARDHSSSVAAAGALNARGWRAESLPLDANGRLDLGGDWASDGPALLCVTVVCGQTGVVEDMARVTAWCRSEPGRLVHADATQALGLCGASFHDLGVTTMACAPHKFGGPRGIGALVIRAGSKLEPLAPGSQELGLRGGTEAVALAVGVALALERADAERTAADGWRSCGRISRRG